MACPLTIQNNYLYAFIVFQQPNLFSHIPSYLGSPPEQFCISLFHFVLSITSFPFSPTLPILYITYNYITQIFQQPFFHLVPISLNRLQTSAIVSRSLQFSLYSLHLICSSPPICGFKQPLLLHHTRYSSPPLLLGYLYQMSFPTIRAITPNLQLD